MVKLLAAGIFYYLGHKTGHVVIPPITTYIKNSETIQKAYLSASQSLRGYFGFDKEKSNDSKTNQTTNPDRNADSAGVPIQK